METSSYHLHISQADLLVFSDKENYCVYFRVHLYINKMRSKQFYLFHSASVYNNLELCLSKGLGSARICCVYYTFSDSMGCVGTAGLGFTRVLDGFRRIMNTADSFSIYTQI